MKKQEMINRMGYWLESFEEDFINDFERYGPDNFELFKGWHRAVSLYMQMFKSMTGHYPPYNSEFMQALAKAEIGGFFFVVDFRLDGESLSEYDERRRVA